MVEKKILITTVGTSLFENFFLSYKGNLKDIYDDLCINEEVQCCSEAWQDNAEDIKLLRKAVLAWALAEWTEKKNEISAEIKSIKKIYEHFHKMNLDIRTNLLSTDSALSRLASEIIRDLFITKEDIPIYFDSEKGDLIRDLQVYDKQRFKEVGLTNLVKRIGDVCEQKYSSLIINITGGYKALIPYLTIIGQVYDVPIFYIFERTDELISIPQAPFDFDFSYIEENYVAFESIKPDKMEKNLPLIEDFKKDLNPVSHQADELFRLLEDRGLLTSFNGGTKVKLSFLGKMLFDKYEKLFNSRMFHRQNLLGELMELKLYEYYQDKYSSSGKVYHSYKYSTIVDAKKYDCEIDILLELTDKIIAIEVKPGGNIPISGKEGSIEDKLNNIAFNKMLKEMAARKGKGAEVRVYCYLHKTLHDRVIKQIKEFTKQYCASRKDINLSWYRLAVDPNYKTNMDWKITSNSIEQVYPL